MFVIFTDLRGNRHAVAPAHVVLVSEGTYEGETRTQILLAASGGNSYTPTSIVVAQTLDSVLKVLS